MEGTKNPYKTGSPCYLAWEFGYTAALEDIKKLEDVAEAQHDREDQHEGRNRPEVKAD